MTRGASVLMVTCACAYGPAGKVTAGVESATCDELVLTAISTADGGNVTPPGRANVAIAENAPPREGTNVALAESPPAAPVLLTTSEPLASLTASMPPRSRETLSRLIV